MKMPFELGLFAGAAFVAGWMASRSEYVAMAILGVVSLGALYDFQREYRRDLNAARKYREMRWNEWQALEKKYRDECGAFMPPALAHLNERIYAAEKRAKDEITEKYGPIT
jgi:hypothetical protein